MDGGNVHFGLVLGVYQLLRFEPLVVPHLV